MQVEHNKSLQQLNTFGFAVSADNYLRADSLDQITAAIDWANARSLQTLVLGGGSNIVFAGPVPGLVLDVETRGIKVIAEDSDTVELSVAAGENWHDFVNWCIDHGYHGLENLSLIPGKIGAAPIQNIGAYGVELSDCFERLNAIELNSGKRVTLGKTDCRFAYRDSIFKQSYRQSHVITDVVLKLHKQFYPQLDYGNVRGYLEQSNRTATNARDVADTICDIRRSKLPDPAELGNAGSFFTNPIVSLEKYQHLLLEHPAVIGYPSGGNHVKLAAGWLVEQCGWKGFRRDGVGVHDRQSLVLVNHGSGDGNHLLALAEDIRSSVIDRFGVTLVIEPLVLQ